MKRLPFLFAALLFPVITSVWAAPPFPPPGNMAAAVAALQAQVMALQADLAAETAARLAAEAALANQISTIGGNSVLQLNGKLSLDNTDASHPIARFNGVNVQIINGLGATSVDPGNPESDPGATNGLGNLIVGYNEIRPGDDPLVVRTGSHNLIVGVWHRYMSYGGLVAGFRNTISGPFANVSGGRNHTVSGAYAVVSGGSNCNGSRLADWSVGTAHFYTSDCIPPFTDP